MHVVVVLLAVVVALAAAARSTWSPCGQSMLSQITPVAESGRGRRYAATARWFIVGAAVGGATLGGATAALAALVARVGISGRTAIVAVAACALAGAVLDTHLLGIGPPFVRRQVNEDWLSRYRSWVYGSGFGWQIGTGVVTYVMTAAVPLTIVLAALTASPWAAFAVSVGFGLTRGLTVLLSAPLRTQPDLFAFHRRFAAAAEPVRYAVIAVQLAVSVGAAWVAAPAPIAATLSAGALGLVVWMGRRVLRSSGTFVARGAVSASPQ